MLTRGRSCLREERGERFVARAAAIEIRFPRIEQRLFQPRRRQRRARESQIPYFERLDERDSFKANPIWWWEPGIVGYKPDGTPVFCKGGDRPA